LKAVTQRGTEGDIDLPPDRVKFKFNGNVVAQEVT